VTLWVGQLSLICTIPQHYVNDRHGLFFHSCSRQRPSRVIHALPCVCAMIRLGRDPHLGNLNDERILHTRLQFQIPKNFRLRYDYVPHHVHQGVPPLAFFWWNVLVAEPKAPCGGSLPVIIHQPRRRCSNSCRVELTIPRTLRIA
jgi:hypothetical protein